MADRDIEQAGDQALPAPVAWEPGQPLPDLPPLPDGYEWQLVATAEADVIHPDGSVN